jgi:hypothetical protein
MRPLRDGGVISGNVTGEGIPSAAASAPSKRTKPARRNGGQDCCRARLMCENPTRFFPP